MKRTTQNYNLNQAGEWGLAARVTLHTICALTTKVARGTVHASTIPPHVSRAVLQAKTAAHYANRALDALDAETNRYCDCGNLAEHFREPKADYDPACARCYERRFCHCPNCGQETEISNVHFVETLPATRLSPAEGVEVCDACCGDDRDEDDAAYDRWLDRQMSRD